LHYSVTVALQHHFTTFSSYAPHWASHGETTLLMMLITRAGMEELSTIVRVRRLTLAGHILRLPSDRRANVAICNGYLMEAREEEDVQRRPDDKHSRKIYRRCQSAGVVFAEWQLIGVGGKVSTPNAAAPAGVQDLSLSPSELRRLLYILFYYLMLLYHISSSSSSSSLRLLQ